MLAAAPAADAGLIGRDIKRHLQTAPRQPAREHLQRAEGNAARRSGHFKAAAVSSLSLFLKESDFS